VAILRVPVISLIFKDSHSCYQGDARKCAAWSLGRIIRRGEFDITEYTRMQWDKMNRSFSAAPNVIWFCTLQSCLQVCNLKNWALGWGLRTFRREICGRKILNKLICRSIGVIKAEASHNWMWSKRVMKQWWANTRKRHSLQGCRKLTQAASPVHLSLQCDHDIDLCVTIFHTARDGIYF